MAISTYMSAAGDSLTVASSNQSVIGSTGSQTVLVNSGVTGISLDANIERIELSGALADYRFVAVAGTGLQIQTAAGAVVNTIGSLNQNATLAFTDGSATLAQTGSTAFTVAGTSVVVGATSAAAAVTATTALATGTGNVSTVSSSSSSSTPTFSVTGSSAVSEGATASFVVGLANRSSGAYTVLVTPSATGSSTAGTDYTSTLTLDSASTAAGITYSTSTGLLTIPSSSSVTSSTFTTAVAADSTSPETGESITVTLSSATGTSVALSSTATSVATTITDVPLTYTLTASSSSVYEGVAVTYTLTASATSSTATAVDFSVVAGDTASANQGSSTTNLNDFASGAFNPSSVTIAAGSKTATYIVTSATDTLTELPESYSVKAVSGTTTLATVTTSLLDGTSSTTSSGTSYTLTTSGDQFPGTTANDTFTAGVATTVATSTDTLNSTDVIAGGSGTDTMNLNVTGTNTDVTMGSQLSGIETMNIRVTSGTGTFNASLDSGVTGVYADRGAGALTVTALPSGAAIGVIGNATITNGTTSFAYSTASLAPTVNISGGTLGGNITATSGAGITTATINTTGTAANSVGTILLDSTNGGTVTALTINAASALNGTLTATDFATTSAVTIAGAAADIAQTASVTAGPAVQLIATTNFKTVDASGLTAGGVSMTSGTVLTSFKGGVGNDVFTTAVYASPTTGMIAAGSGTDTLVLSSTTVMDSAGEAAYYTGFETLRTAGAQDLSLLSTITALQVTAAGTQSNMTATQAAAVQLRADIGATAFSLANSAGTADVLSLTMGPAAADATESYDLTGALTINGFETLNITTGAGTAASTTALKTTSINSLTADKLVAINAYGHTVDILNAATTLPVNISGASLTGSLTVSGTVVNLSTVTGSAGNDVFTITVEGSTYNGGSGNDGFTVTNSALVADGTTDLTIGGGAGTDTLTIATTGTLTDNYFTNVTGFENLATALTTAISYTGFGTAAKTAFADSMTITSGTLADGATYTVGAGLYDKPVTLTLVSSGDGTTTADNIAITTGAGADVVSVTAASWVGTTGGAHGLLSVASGSGNDTISVTTGTITSMTTSASVSITGGTGADTISLTGVNAAVGSSAVVINVASGESTTSAYDSITGFDVATGGLISSTLNLNGTPSLTTYSATAASGFTSGELTVAVSSLGLVTFAGTSATSVTLAQKIAAVQSVVLTNNDDVAVFTNGSNSYVFQNHATLGDTVIELIGVAAVAMTTTIATTTANYIHVS